MPNPGFPPVRARGRGAGWYRGDCHVHSVYSDGELSPEELTAGARAAGLDFIATTEHNSAASMGAWEPHAADDFLVVLGQEVTTRAGHWLAVGIAPGQVIDWDYGAGDALIGRSLDRVHASGGLCVVAHPYAPYPSGSFMYSHQDLDAIEVWNGLWASDRPWNADNETALAEWGRGLADGVRAGLWRPAMGNSDTHLIGQIGIPHTVVLAEGLNTPALLAGLRAGRSWIAESSGVELSLAVVAAGRTAGIGEHLATCGAPVTVRAHIRGVPSAGVSFHTQRGEVHRVMLPESGAGTAVWRTTAQNTSFVRIEVRHPYGHMAALTNPVVLV
ncbi:CehA/McbA family metallohydrolase [Streptomyces sp. NPDC001822]|uniref:CehA/McbA family metallohydrolase n=1 Tax=Streptomyces sp. NPDC001822 TaxID=3364614 RepID=UPI0036984D18